MDSTTSEQGTTLHFGFIDFLFSLAAAQVAIKFSELVGDGDTLGNYADSKYWPAYSHLALSLTLIVTSWIGWNRSKFSHANTRDISSVWNLDFLEIVIDVLLVITYYVLVEHTDLTQGASSGSQPAVQKLASVKPESYAIVIVFVLYFMWDIVSKLPRSQEQADWRPLWERSAMSAVCFIISLLIYLFFSSRPTQVWQIVVFDLSLFGLVAFFRDLKSQPTWSWGIVSSHRMRVSIGVMILPLVILGIDWYLNP